jgi:sugar lactone lactonase YvrE
VPDPELVLTGLSMGESPRWHEDRLWLADWGAGEVLAVDGDGRREVVARVEAAPISLAWTPDGALRIVAGTEVLGQDSSGALARVADLAPVSTHPWNEIIVDGRGNTYVNAIGFDMMGGAPPAPGCVALVGTDGRVRQVADQVEFPNGMVVTPDNATLILAESYANRLTAFDIEPDGSLSNRRVWADLGEGCPDGLAHDADGAVWYADVPNRRCVRVREGGEVLETVALDLGCFACALGGPDGRTLFVVAAEWGEAGIDLERRTGQVLRVDAPAPGAGWP